MVKKCHKLSDENFAMEIFTGEGVGGEQLFCVNIHVCGTSKGKFILLLMVVLLQALWFLPTIHVTHDPYGIGSNPGEVGRNSVPCQYLSYVCKCQIQALFIILSFKCYDYIVIMSRMRLDLTI